MAELKIEDASLTLLKDTVVVVTGGASGIGLATVKLLLEQGASVVVGDKNEVEEPLDPARFAFVRTDVTAWSDLRRLFDLAIEKYQRIDHVFANAGIATPISFVDDSFEDDGSLKQPDHSVLNINLIAVLDTVKLAIHHIRKNPNGGSIVLTASSSSYQRFSAVEYTTSKHGVLGIMRGLHHWLSPNIPIRMNCICPSWTETGLVKESIAKSAGIRSQPAGAVARSVALLMADRNRNSQLIYSCQGKYSEFEEGLLAATDALLQHAPSIDPRTVTEEEEYHMYQKVYMSTG